MKLTEQLKSKLRSIKESPEKVSCGYALGVFLGTTPFIGTKVLIALGITSFLRWNRLASVIGVYHINILTGPIFYGTAFAVGRWITGSDTSLVIPHRMSASWIFSTFLGSWEILRSLLAGGLLLGIPLAATAGYLSYAFLRKSCNIQVSGTKNQML